jgi:hypothetical protein
MWSRRLTWSRRLRRRWRLTWSRQITWSRRLLRMTTVRRRMVRDWGEASSRSTTG